MLDLLKNPFISGILGFIIGALLFYIHGLIKRMVLKNDIKHLKNNIVTTMDEHHQNLETIKNQQEQITNLNNRIINQKATIEVLKQKPSQRDTRELRQYAEACAMMTKNAPGFAQAWQNCLEEIAKKEEEENAGYIIFAKPLQKLINIFKKPAALVSVDESVLEDSKTNLQGQSISTKNNKEK